MKRIFYLTLVAVTVITACQPKTASVDVLAEADAIRNLEIQWEDAIKTKDIDKTLSFYAPNVVNMPENSQIITGIEAMKKKFESAFADTTSITSSISIDIIEVSTSGDLAYVRGNEPYSYNTPDGFHEGEGKYIDIWKKIDGEWKCIVRIGNSTKR